MNLIILSSAQKAIVDTDTIIGIENYSPANTFRYNLDKSDHIKLRLDLNSTQLAELIKDISEIVMYPPENE